MDIKKTGYDKAFGASLFWLKNTETFQQVGVIAYDLDGAVAAAARKGAPSNLDFARWHVENVTPLRQGFVIERTETPLY
jgi:hypothetical protein